MSSSNSHSPSDSPVHSHHNIMPNSTGSGFGSAVGTNAGLRSLNPTWQVWGGAPANTKRNVSGSSSSGAPDSIAEGWTQSRSTSGSWTDDAAHHSPQRKELAQMDSHGSLYSRPRQAPVSAGKQQQFSPQRSPARYDAMGFEQPSSRSVSLGSATKAGPFGSQSLFPVVEDHRNSVQPSGLVENDLVTAMRGMAVEDDSAYRQQRSNTVTAPQQHGATSSQQHAPHHAHRMSYGGYPSADYASYYNTQAGQVDYNYAYPTPDPSLYAMSPALSAASTTPYQSATSPPMHVADPRQAPGVYYDARHASQYYYTHSPLVYRASAPSPMVAHQAPATLSDKKRELQYHITHNQAVGPIFPSIRPAPAPAQGYVDLTYGSALPMMMPGTPVYGHASLDSPTMSRYPAALRNGRRDSNEPGMAVRSPLLEEFRTNKNRKWELRDIFGFVVEFSSDQHGSRFIQQRLENSTPEERQRVFDEIVPTNALHLSQDVFGNYVIQKLFEHGTPVQRSILASTMESHIHALSLQMYGCRVVQKAVEYITPDQQALFVQELNVHVMKCVKDANGNHVIQKLIERVSPDKLGFVDTFRGSVYELSTHPYGCRVLQRCFEHLSDDKTRPLLDELHKYTANLMQDQFGNYVVQFVLEHGSPHDRDQVIDRLRGQMLNMARHKFASNVCEKALVTASPVTRVKLIEEILTPKADGVSPVVLMMKDQFANYVLQRAMTVVEGDQKELLLGKVRPQLNSMRRYSSVYSKHLLAIERLLEKLDKATAPAGGARDPPLTA